VNIMRAESAQRMHIVTLITVSVTMGSMGMDTAAKKYKKPADQTLA